jgi:hypothetical protein
MKSPSSMRNGRFHPPKYKGKVQKTREETLKELFSNLLSTGYFFWADVVNSYWLALALACLAQTSVRIFISP